MQFKDMISLNELKSRMETARKGSINLRLTESTQTNPKIKKKKVKKNWKQLSVPQQRTVISGPSVLERHGCWSGVGL